MNEGSVQGLDAIPADIQDRYRTVYEYGWTDLIDMMADRSPFVSQTSSYNHYTTYEESGPTAFTQKSIYAWKKGLKTTSPTTNTPKQPPLRRRNSEATSRASKNQSKRR